MTLVWVSTALSWWLHCLYQLEGREKHFKTLQFIFWLQLPLAATHPSGQHQDCWTIDYWSILAWNRGPLFSAVCILLSLLQCPWALERMMPMSCLGLSSQLTFSPSWATILGLHLWKGRHFWSRLRAAFTYGYKHRYWRGNLALCWFSNTTLNFPPGLMTFRGLLLAGFTALGIRPYSGEWAWGTAWREGG